MITYRVSIGAYDCTRTIATGIVFEWPCVIYRWSDTIARVLGRRLGRVVGIGLCADEFTCTAACCFEGVGLVRGRGGPEEKSRDEERKGPHGPPNVG